MLDVDVSLLLDRLNRELADHLLLLLHRKSLPLLCILNDRAESWTVDPLPLIGQPPPVHLHLSQFLDSLLNLSVIPFLVSWGFICSDAT